MIHQLIRVGNEEAAGCQGGCSLVNTSATLKFLGTLDALFSSESRIQLRVVCQLGALTQLEDVIATLTITAAGALSASACRVVCRAGRFVDGLLVLLGSAGEALGALRGAGDKAGVARGGAASRGAVMCLASGTGAAASAAAGAAVVLVLLVLAGGHHRAGIIVVVAPVAVNLSSTEAKRNAADTNVRLAGCIANDLGLAAVPNLAGDLGGGEARLGASRGVAADNLEVGTHLGGTLLSDETGILVLGALAPDRCFLLAEEGDVAAAAALCGDGAARGRTAEVAGRGAVGGRGLLLEARGVAKGPDGRRPAP